ncbi:MAG: class I SAM-dependent methyltransferase [Spirochaetes bacterium]|nr:class I SAM-dependent methyltransferase [Spirochaetota bacterium]
MNLYEIKDECRKNLNKYTIQAFSFIPKIEYPTILDIGCGTGVPSLSLIEICNGTIYAVDSDQLCLNWFKEKVTALNLNDRIKIFNESIFNPALFHFRFDIILAEGLLNVIGFKKGLPILINYLKHDGYLIIHDELKNDSEKRIIFEKSNLKLLNSFEIDKDVWLNEYFNCLEMKIKNINDDNQFENEIKEIYEHKSDSNNLYSIYYILQNET